MRAPFFETQCIYLPPDTSQCAPLNPSQKGWYSIDLHRKDGRLNRPKLNSEEHVVNFISQCSRDILINTLQM